jgi:hypothetical protein
VDLLAFAFGAGDFGFVVFFETKDQLEGLLAIFTIIFVTGHRGLQ